jgi:hypothetical protein
MGQHRIITAAKRKLADVAAGVYASGHVVNKSICPLLLTGDLSAFGFQAA